MLTTLLDRAAGWPAPLVLALAGLLLLAESGTLVGLFLPGTTLLVALGWWSAAAGLPAAAPCAVAAVATVGGALGGWRCARRPGALAPAGRWRTRSEPVVRRLRCWLGDPGSAVVVLVAGHWASAARTLSPRVAGAAGVPLRTAVPTLAGSGTAWALTLVLAGREVGPRLASTAQWLPLAGLSLVVGALLLRQRFSRARRAPAGARGQEPAEPVGARCGGRL